MSLKSFHLVFITASILLSLGLTVWGGREDLLLSVFGGISSVTLGIYLRVVLKKLKSVSYY
jgi:hypothetical protein